VTQNSEATDGTTAKGEGFLHRLFGKGAHEAAHPEAKAEIATPGLLSLEDVQGFILRGYRMPMVRHFLLQVGVAAEARKLLGRLVSGDESDAPQITSARDWHVGFAPGTASSAGCWAISSIPTSRTNTSSC